MMKKKQRNDQRLSDELNRALLMGKKNWREHITNMQALKEIPGLFDRDIATLDAMLKMFLDEGGTLSHRKEGDSMVYEVTYGSAAAIVAYYAATGRTKYIKTAVDGDFTKQMAVRMREAVAVHHEMARRKFAKGLFVTVLEYLEDAAAKDSFEHVLDKLDGNGEILFNAANASPGVFDVDLDKILEMI